MSEFGWQILVPEVGDGLRRHHVTFKAERWNVHFDGEIEEDSVDTEARAEAERRIRQRVDLGDTADRKIWIRRSDVGPRRSR